MCAGRQCIHCLLYCMVCCELDEWTALTSWTGKDLAVWVHSVFVVHATRTVRQGEVLTRFKLYCGWFSLISSHLEKCCP